MVSKRRNPSGAKAQTISEYAMLIMVITVAIVVVYPMVKRGTQSLVRSASDQIAYQNEAEQNFTSGDGHVVISETKTDLNSTTGTILKPGAVVYATTGKTITNTYTYTNAGFTREED